MAGSFTGVLITALMAVHLLAHYGKADGAGQAFARHAPAVSGSAPGVHVLYAAPTTPGPSPSNGHKKQLSIDEVLDGALNGTHGVSTLTENRNASCTISCHHPTMGGDKPQLNATGNGEVSGDRA